jgi:chain length determinant protein tyrosine kinase EpsG
MDIVSIADLASSREGARPFSKSMGLQLVESGKISAEDAERVLQLQKEQNLRFGAAAVQLGLVTEADILQVLARQFDYAYLGVEGGFSEQLVAAYQPFSPQVERLRALRSQLMLRWFAKGRKTMIMVGAELGDGTSYLTANLGVVFSQLGERTLLIDASLRRPSLHTYFQLGNHLGLSDILAERAGLNAIIRIPHLLDLSLLPAGTLAPNPSELLARGKMAELMDTLSGHYDVILIDTSPAADSADFQVMGARVGGALVAVRKNHTRLNEVGIIKDMLATAGVEIVGAVINEH